MSKNLLRLLLLLPVTTLFLNGFGQSFTGTYPFTNVASGSGGRIDPTPVPTATGVVFGSFSAVAPTGNPNSLGANPNAAQRFSFQGWPTGATNGSDVFTGSINTDQYYEVTITPASGYAIDLTSITFTLQRSATGIRQYSVRSGNDSYAANLPASVSPANANLQVVTDNVFQVTDPTTSAQTGSTITLTGFTGLTSAATFRFYGWNAEGSGGTFSIDNVVFTGSATAVSVPSVNISTTAIAFPNTNISATSSSSYTLNGTNLTGDVLISTAAPYSVSLDNTTFSTGATIPLADATAGATVYVRFSPTAAGTFNGSILHTTSGGANKTITLSGEGIDPSNLTFNFNSCTVSSIPGSGFLSINTTGSQMWGCSSFGRNSTNGVSVNGFSSGSAQTNEAWLISPSLNLGSIVNMPILSFYSRGEFSGPKLQLYVSTDYAGSGSPASATWTEITTANFPTPPGTATTVWTLSDNIDLSAYKSAPNVYIAFKYTSSAALNAARWSVDDITITDQSTLLSVSPATLGFGEIATGTNSTSQSISVKSVGNSDITLTVPSGYQISANNTTFSSSPLVIDQATAAAGTTVYIRFSPTVKKLNNTGDLNITSTTGLNQNRVALSGSSYIRAETFDVACYNMAFFGSNPTNNATPAKITGQINNIATVIQHLNVDVIGFEEVSSDSALNELLLLLPGYSAVTSNRWSYSFEAPNPNFPPQKIGFIYNTATMTLSATEPPRVLFEAMYDSVLAGQSLRVGDNFWASGRLPYMATFDANINGQLKKVRLVVVHGKAGSAQSDFNRRVFDAQVLKDTLDAVYKNDNVIILGDYNDRLYGSIYSGSTVSSYNGFVTDNASYAPLTRSLDSAGKVSFIGGSGLIDHIITTQSLRTNYIDSSIAIEDARLYIPGYDDSTASDHLPVYARFSFAVSGPLPVTLLEFTARPKESVVLVNWTTAMEQNNKYFNIERSADGRNFTAIGRVAGAGNSNSGLHYQFTDVNPLPGISYYRLQQVDLDGKSSLSSIATVRMANEGKATLTMLPNPVTSYVNININTTGKTYTMRVSGVDGRIFINGTGSVSQLNQQLNSRLSSLAPGLYVLNADNAGEHYTIKFVKQ
ncbi:T9SS type A sorting domain-containing protein [Niastella caeni]|uniref:T9SS type A sorting domain-containing protein n=1 Tax=Niastella caeni TaxID=2569763 RepID=A0A4S8HCY5_9BACT|nr:endonuclease/exonuclease/phosphatase family protein [Niastella caeni]THU31959.1 T9SS type A sorting domain-containing protein [Niastella caeni]